MRNYVDVPCSSSTTAVRVLYEISPGFEELRHTCVYPVVSPVDRTPGITFCGAFRGRAGSGSPPRCTYGMPSKTPYAQKRKCAQTYLPRVRSPPYGMRMSSHIELASPVYGGGLHYTIKMAHTAAGISSHLSKAGPSIPTRLATFVKTASIRSSWLMYLRWNMEMP